MNDAGGMSPLDAMAANVVAKNLAMYLGQFSPQDVAVWCKSNKDMAAEIACPLTIPNFGVARSVVRRYLTSVDNRFFEAVRIRISQALPVHAALLGKDSVWPWYAQNMIRVRDRLLADLDAVNTGEGAKTHDRSRQDGVGMGGGADDSRGPGKRGILLRHQI
jgi:hypothetical protein